MENSKAITNPTYRARINITQTAKEYRAETTVEMNWAGEALFVATPHGVEPLDLVLRLINQIVDQEARTEIGRREALDNQVPE